jgi:hypothetical protein
MPYLQHIRKALSAFFLLIFCMFSASAFNLPADSHHVNSSDKFFNIPVSTAWVAREEVSEFSSHIIKDSFSLIQHRKTGELLLRKKLFANDALRVPLGSFNPFYIFVSIHAP